MYDDSPPPNVSVDIELLIEEIRKRPVLWDRFTFEHNDRVMKVKLWDEVHEAVFDDWAQLASADKRIRGEEIKKKWRNLRDTFAKEIVMQKKAKKGKMKKKRPYRYYKDLLFLSGQFKERGKETSTDSSDDDDDDSKPRRKSKRDADFVASNLVIDVGELIREVKCRPLLWNKQSQLSERNLEREMREKLWTEICEIMFDNWAELGSAAKALRTMEVKKKWRNLRDSYGRELGSQRKAELGIIRPKRPYRFFKELSFLHGTLEKRPTDEYSLLENQMEIEVASSSYSLESEFEDETVKPIEPKKEEIVVKTYDEDVCFAEMLVPMLKRLNDDQKHYAQVKILNVLKRARQFDPLGNYEQRNTDVVDSLNGKRQPAASR